MRQAMPRQRKQLPQELLEGNSDLIQMVMLVGDLADQRHENTQAAINMTRSRIHAACPHYKPSLHTDSRPVICRSGEENGRAYRGRVCGTCNVSQFSSGMFFTGEIVRISGVSTH